jgi:hypothetical protein
MTHPNLLAVLVAALATFVIGGPWYRFFGPLRDRTAQPDDKTGKRHPAKVFGSAYVLALIAAYGLGMLIGAAPTVGRGFHVGAMVGIAFVATSFGISYAFDGRSLRTWFIDAGYHLVKFIAFGVVIGLFG